MRRICLVKNGHVFLDEIKRFLEQANAEVFFLDLEAAAHRMDEDRPDLVIASTANKSRLLLADRDTTMVLIGDELPPGQLIRSRESRNIILLGWPLEQKDFLDLTSRVLSVPKRRIHRTTVIVSPKDSTDTCRGVSEDFSLTGIAFRADYPLKPRDEVTVAIGGDGLERTLKLGVEIVRSIPVIGGGPTLFGGRFVGLTPSDRHLLERFVWRLRP